MAITNTKKARESFKRGGGPGDGKNNSSNKSTSRGPAGGASGGIGGVSANKMSNTRGKARAAKTSSAKNNTPRGPNERDSNSKADDRSSAFQTYNIKKAKGNLGRLDRMGGALQYKNGVLIDETGRPVEDTFRGGFTGDLTDNEKTLETFTDSESNYPKYTPGYLKFLGDLNRRPNREYFVENVLRAGKIPGLNYGMLGEEDFDLEKEYKDYMSRRLSGEIDAMGNPMPFTGGGIDAKSAGAERGDITALPLVQDKVIDEEEKDPIAYRFLADGGRAAFQEGGGIFPRLNELGSNVSSAEQELAALSQKINSAESTLGEGGGDEGGLGSIMPENNFTNPTLEAFSGAKVNVPVSNNTTFPDNLTLQTGSGDLFGSLNKPLETLQATTEPLETLQATTGGGLLNNFSPGIDPMGSRKENLTGTPMQFANSAPSTNLPGSGAPQAGDVVYDPTGMPNIFAPRNGYADGGMSEYEGGIMDLESGRQQYFLGKLVKKAKKTIGKIYKSPLGKAALLGLGAQGLMSGKGLGIKDFLTRSFLGKEVSGGGPSGRGRTGGILNFLKDNPLASIAGVSGLAGLMSKDDEEEYQDTYTGADFDLEGARKFPYKAMGGAYRFYANGGRTGYSSGSEDLSKNKIYQKWVQRYEANPDSPLVTMHEKANTFKNFYERSKNAKAEGGEPVAKETMPLLDIGGKEMDLRAEGGFVPIGRMEKADDVPARLSKNEFVFTADAVRNAGNGNVDKGAEVMYKTMKNLEAGGKMSKKSQGLEGIL